MSKVSNRGTLAYFQRRTWRDIQTRCVNGQFFNPTDTRYKYYTKNQIKVRISKEAYYSWCAANWTKIDQLYKSGKVPSIDRVDTLGDYTLSNLQILDLTDNIMKDAKNKPIQVFDLKGNSFIYNSVNLASKHLKITAIGLIRVAQGKQRHTHTFRAGYL